jgi:hypothetical protein
MRHIHFQQEGICGSFPQINPTALLRPFMSHDDTIMQL